MHLGTAALLKFYAEHRNDESLVLVTVIGTAGSTYRKTGAMMLISSNHEYVGMISGGCLEGDLLHHADDVFASGEAHKVTYDMHAGDDLVWGLGIGCDGIIHLLLQRLERERGFQWLDWLSNSLLARQPVIVAMHVAEQTAELNPGEMALLNSDAKSLGNPMLARIAGQAVLSGWPGWRYKQAEPGCLLIQITPQPSVLICGAGPDAVPVAEQFVALGWECRVVDHRASFANPGHFAEACITLVTRPEQLHLVAELEQIDAAIIMAHHLENDAAYLRQLAPMRGSKLQPGSLAYLGVLGPSARRSKLCEMAACAAELIYGPVGLDIAAELPEAIALSIAAEVHAVLNQRNGLSLTHKISSARR